MFRAGRWVDDQTETHGQTGMTKHIVSFLDFVNGFPHKKITEIIGVVMTQRTCRREDELWPCDAHSDRGFR